MVFAKLDRNSLAKQVVREIRRQIFSGVLKSGERIVETEIAVAMGISRGPIREAFAELVKEGLLILYPQQGTYVKNFAIKDIEEIYTLRALLEGYAVILALDRLQEEDLNWLREVLDRISEAAEKKDLIELAQQNMQFHQKIMDLSDHELICATWRRLLAQTRMLSAMTTEFYNEPVNLRKTHETLLNALITRDKDQCKKCFEDHILVSMHELIDYMKKMPSQEGSQAILPSSPAVRPMEKADLGRE
jgi:DNA-binding GntR family transcriptional regulator